MDRDIPTLVVAVGASALVFGIAATFAGGTLRSVALILLYLAALGLTVLAARRFAGQATVTTDEIEYIAPDAASARGIHIVVTALYNLGIATVVLAGVVRLGLLAIGFSDIVIASFPFVLGAYVLLLAFATRFRMAEQGGTYANWYTRNHGIVVGLVAVPILVLAFALIAKPEIHLGGLTVVERDLLVFILVGILTVGTQLFLSLRLPNVVDLFTQIIRGFAGSGDRKDTPPIVYVMIMTLAATAIIAWILLQFDLLSNLRTSFADARVTFLILLLPIGLAVFFAISTAAIWREGRRGLYREKISTKLRNDIVVYGISTFMGLVFGGLLVAALAGRTQVGPFILSDRAVMDLTMLTIVTTAGPIGFYIQREIKRIDDIEGRLADFLNDLADSRRAGLPLASGLRNAAKTDYGSLSAEVDIMARQVSWGVPFNDALERMARRVRSSLVRRAVTLVIEASHTGGSVADILKAAARDAYEIKALQADRRVAMLTYLVVIYVVFFVFMVVIGILEIRFIPQVSAAADATEGSDFGTGFTLGAIDPVVLRQIYFNAAMVQAMGNGLVGGILSEGRVMSGFRHIAIMAIAGWVTFRFILPTM